MANDILALLVAVVAIITSAATAYLAYVIYKYNRLSKGWLAIVYAASLAILTRVLAFMRNFEFLNFINVDNFQLLNNLLYIATSVLATSGFWFMKKRFESFEIVEKRTREKIKLLNKKRKR